jgi:hypothetical protein
MATAASGPVAPAGSVPAQAGLAALRFQDNVTTTGTPGVNCAVLGGPPVAAQPAESQTTWPLLVTTTRVNGGVYATWHGDGAVDTTYAVNSGCSRGPYRGLLVDRLSTMPDGWHWRPAGAVPPADATPAGALAGADTDEVPGAAPAGDGVTGGP